jgi:small subunit ribosomal protein S17
MTAGQGVYGGRKVREGTVVSDKMTQTVVVAVHSAIRHPLYKKTIRRVRKYMAHDEDEKAQIGDRVRIVEAAPISKHKRWRVAEVLSHGDVPELAPEAIDATLVEDLAAPLTPPAPKAAARPEAVPEDAVAPPEVEAAEPPSAVEPEESPEEAPIEEMDVVESDAGPEALETPEDTLSEEAVELGEPEVPAIEEAEVVQADAPPEALEPVDPAKGETE